MTRAGERRPHRAEPPSAARTAGLLALALVAGMAPADHPGYAAASVIPQLTFGPEVGGLRARIRLPKREFAVGEPVPVSYVVRNVSEVEREVWHSGFWPNHRIHVVGPDGREPPLTARGRARRDAFGLARERTKNLAVRLAPGGEDATYGDVDLSSLFDLTREGQYRVQYVYEERQGGWSGRLPSNEVTFRIVRR